MLAFVDESMALRIEAGKRVVDKRAHSQSGCCSVRLGAPADPFGSCGNQVSRLPLYIYVFRPYCGVAIWWGMLRVPKLRVNMNVDFLAL